MNPVMHARDVHHATSVQEFRMLTSGVLLSHGISYQSQETLFDRGAPVLRAIHRIGVTGLGSRNTIVSNISEAVKLMEVDYFYPQLRLITEHKLPMAINMDGSVHKGGAGIKGGAGDGELVSVFTPLFGKPLTLDWKSMVKSPNAEQLVTLARAAVSGEVQASGIYTTVGKDGLLGLHDVAMAQAGPAGVAAPPAPQVQVGYKYLTPEEVLRHHVISGADIFS